MKTSSPVSAYRKDEKGGLAVLVAFMTLALISITALAVDFGMAKAKRVSIQAATDMGALAGAHKLLVSGVQTSAVINEARNIALANDSNAAFGTPQLGIWLNGTFTTGGAGTPNAVRVTATGSVSTYFGGVLGFSSLNAAAESIAAVGAPVTASCVVPFGMEDITLTGHSYGDTIFQ